MAAPSIPSTVQLVRHLDPWAIACDNYIGANASFVGAIADRLGIPRRFISLLLTFFAVSFLLLGLGQTLVATLVGVVYPAYQSMKALEACSQQGREGAPAPFDCINQWCVRRQRLVCGAHLTRAAIPTLP
jgi:hypothetical protein